MKPVAVITGDFVRTGGQDMANFALASYIARAVRTVKLVAHRVDPALLQHSNVAFEKVRKPLNSYLLGGPLLRRCGAAVGAAILREGGRVVVNGGNCPLPDVNWVHYVHRAYASAPQGSLLRRAKHRYARWCHLREEAAAFRVARRFIANSNRTKEDLIRDYQIDASKIDVVYYGTDADRFAPATHDERTATRRALGWSDNRCYVAFVGAMADRRKGFDTLFEAWQRFRASPTQATLVVIGTGAELADWKQKSAAAGLGQSIQFLGFRSDVHSILRSCDALVSPTRYEAYGLGVHEALCCGIPAIVSAAAGVAERYPPEYRELLLPDAGDVNDLATRLRECVTNSVQWRSKMIPFSAQLRQRTWDDMASDICHLLERTGDD